MGAAATPPLPAPFISTFFLRFKPLPRGLRYAIPRLAPPPPVYDIYAPHR